MNGNNNNDKLKIIGIPGLSEKQIISRLECSMQDFKDWLSMDKESKFHSLLPFIVHDFKNLSLSDSDFIVVEKNRPLVNSWPWSSKMRDVLLMEAYKKIKLHEAFIEHLMELLKEIKLPPPEPPLITDAVLISSVTLKTDFLVRMDSKNKIDTFEMGINSLLNYNDSHSVTIITTSNNINFQRAVTSALNNSKQGVFIVD
jgi:hypothetical protein